LDYKSEGVGFHSHYVHFFLFFVQIHGFTEEVNVLEIKGFVQAVNVVHQLLA
jgi:hypothetical protein